ncbi:MAG: hypothetical protein ABSB82_25155 [Terriglobia bacterium]|jgi:hypothetical protein
MAKQGNSLFIIKRAFMHFPGLGSGNGAGAKRFGLRRLAAALGARGLRAHLPDASLRALKAGASCRTPRRLRRNPKIDKSMTMFGSKRLLACSLALGFDGEQGQQNFTPVFNRTHYPADFKCVVAIINLKLLIAAAAFDEVA